VADACVGCMIRTDASRSPSSAARLIQRQRSEGAVEPPRDATDAPALGCPSAQAKSNGADNPPLVHRDYSNSLDRTLTRATSINLKRDVSAGPFAQNGVHTDSPMSNVLSNFGLSPIQNTSRVEPRDPAIDAAMTLTDCFLRRESSLEKLGLLKRENSLGGAAKRPTSMEWKGLDMVMPPPPSEPQMAVPADLPPPPRAERQSSLHSLASIAELTSSDKGARSIFGDQVTGAPAEPLERNLSLVFQHQDSARDLLAAGVVSPCADSSDDDDSGDEGNSKAKPGDYKQVNSYEFFAQNTPQQVYGAGQPQDEEAATDLFAPSFNDLAAVCLNQDTRRQSNAPRATVTNPSWLAPAPPAAKVSTMNLMQHPSDPAPVKYIGKLTVEQRREHVQRYLEKKKRRVWGRKVEYQCRKNLASKRARVHGRFA